MNFFHQYYRKLKSFQKNEKTVVRAGAGSAPPPLNSRQPLTSPPFLDLDSNQQKFLRALMTLLFVQNMHDIFWRILKKYRIQLLYSLFELGLKVYLIRINWKIFQKAIYPFIFVHIWKCFPDFGVGKTLESFAAKTMKQNEFWRTFVIFLILFKIFDIFLDFWRKFPPKYWD